jgi:hypothetical protein
LTLASHERGHAEVLRVGAGEKAGENRGRRLEHDFVVREWIGPIAFGESLKLEESRALPLMLPACIP